MINVLENQKGAIAKLCRKYNVEPDQQESSARPGSTTAKPLK